MKTLNKCPVSGLPVIQKDCWSYAATDHDFNADVLQIGDNIILARQSGYKKSDDVEQFYRLIDLFFSHTQSDKNIFSVLLDYTQTKTTNLSIMRQFIELGLVYIERIDVIVVFGLSRLGKIFTKMGATMLATGAPKIAIRDDYDNAIQYVLQHQAGNVTAEENEKGDFDSLRRNELLKILTRLATGADLSQSIAELPEDDDYFEIFAAVSFAQDGLRRLIQENEIQAKKLRQANRELEKKVLQRTHELELSQERYRTLFMNSPIALFEQDYAQIKLFIDELRRQGVTDLRKYFDSHPEALMKCMELIQLRDVNYEGLRINNVRSIDELPQGKQLLNIEMMDLPRLKEEIVALAEGSLFFEGKGKHKTLFGKTIHTILRSALAPQYEKDWSRVIVSIVDITRQIEIEEALSQSQQRYRSMFEDSPVALLEEDFSEIKRFIDSLKAQGVANIRQYLLEHPEDVIRCLEMIKYIEVNQAAFDLYNAASLEDFISGHEKGSEKRYTSHHISRFADELAALAEGNTRFRGDSLQRTYTGADKYISIRTTIAPGFEQSWSKVLANFTDITEHIRLLNLRRVMAAMAENLELDQLLHHLLKFLEQVINYDSATVFLKENGGFRVVAQRGFSHPQSEIGMLRTVEYPFIRNVVEGKHTIVVPDVASDAKFEQPEDHTMHAWMGIPLLIGNDVVGLMTVENVMPAAYGDQEASLIEDFARQAAIAIKNASLYKDARQQAENLKRRDQILQVVSKLAENLLKGAGLEERLHIDLENLAKVTGADRVYLYENVIIEDELFIKLRYSWESQGIRDHSARFASRMLSYKMVGLSRWSSMLASDQVIRGTVDDFPPDEQISFHNQNIHYLTIVPVFVQKEWWGMLGFDECRGELTWSEAEVDAMRAAAGIIGAVIERERTGDVLLASQKLADLGTLAAGVAHELNSPLQVITGSSEGLLRQIEQKQSIDATRLESSLRMINRSGWRSAEIIRSLLAYTHASGGEYEAVDLNNLVHDTLLLVEHQMRSWMNIAITTELAESMPLWRCDRNQITQVLINLLTNARDAMPQGGNIKISTAYQPEKQHILLKVSDTGTGIPEKIRSKIFNPFFTTKPPGQGTGLGLSISLGIIKSHGGEVEVDSTVGKGTTITLIFPEMVLPAEAPASNKDENTERFIE